MAGAGPDQRIADNHRPVPDVRPAQVCCKDVFLRAKEMKTLDQFIDRSVALVVQVDVHASKTIQQFHAQQVGFLAPATCLFVEIANAEVESAGSCAAVDAGQASASANAADAVVLPTPPPPAHTITSRRLMRLLRFAATGLPRRRYPGLSRAPR